MSENTTARLLENPGIPIILGLLLEFEGPEDIVMRSWVLLLVALWLIYDVFKHTRKYGAWKNVMSCALAGIVFSVQMFLMKTWISKQLSVEQADVYKNLRSEAYLVDTENAITTRFSVRNLSDSDIFLKEIACSMKQLSVQRPDGEMVYARRNIQETTFNKTRIHYGGEAEVSQCILLAFRVFGITAGDVKCGKIDVLAKYALTDQAEIEQTKLFSFYGIKENGHFAWIQEGGTSERNCF